MGHSDQYDMGGKAPDVHRDAQLACGAPWALERVRRLFFWFRFLLSGVGPAGGFREIFRDQGWGGLYPGMSLVLVGVSNGALRFMAYEQIKNWGFERKRRRASRSSGARGRRTTTSWWVCSCCANLTRLEFSLTIPIPLIRSCLVRRSSARCA